MREISQKVGQKDGEMENGREGKIRGPVQEVNSPQITGVPEKEKRRNKGKERITKCFKKISPN